MVLLATSCAGMKKGGGGGGGGGMGGPKNRAAKKRNDGERVNDRITGADIGEPLLDPNNPADLARTDRDLTLRGFPRAAVANPGAVSRVPVEPSGVPITEDQLSAHRDSNAATAREPAATHSATADAGRSREVVPRDSGVENGAPAVDLTDLPSPF